MRPITRLRLRLGLLVGAGVLLMTEAAVSVFAKRTLLLWQAPVPVTQTGAPYLPGNPYLLWEMVPGERSEVGVTVHVNELGFRGNETTIAKPEGQRRIIAVGDSSVYGHGVSDADTFSQVLDDRLPDDIEVLNLGAPGYSTEQTLNLMEMRGWRLQPDLVIVANLWSDNNFDSFVDKQLISDRSALPAPWVGPVSTVLHRSALYRWLDWNIRLKSRAEAVQKVGWMLGKPPSGMDRRVNVNDYAQNLQLLAQTAKKNNSEVIFLGLANSVDLGAETSGAIAWPLYREVMQEVAKQSGCLYVDVKAHFAESELPWEQLFLDEMHPSITGHDLIASLLVQELNPWLIGEGFDVNPASDGTLTVWDDPFSRGEGPAPDSQPAAQVTLSGKVLGAPTGMPIQIDLVDLDPNRDNNGNPMLGSARFDHVDTFEMPAPSTGVFGLRIYFDKEADGPTKGDTVITLYDNPINATGASITNVMIDLRKQTVNVAP